MTGLKLDVLRMLRIFGPCSNAAVARRLKQPLHRTYRAIQSLCDDGYAAHLKLQAWDITEKGRRVFGAMPTTRPVLFEQGE